MHLAVKSCLAVMDTWVWDDAALPAKYFSGIGIITNTWRSYGTPAKIQGAAERIGQGALFAKVPGRPLKGRWGTCESIEDLIISARFCIGLVFEIVFAKDMMK